MTELVIDQRRRDLGGFEVGRVLPSAQRRMVGPFVVLRSHGAGRLPARHPAHGRRAAASAHRPVDRDLPVRRRDHAPRQPRLGAGDPAGRGQLDDRRPRHHPLRALRARAPRGRTACTASRPGWRCRRATRRPSPASRTTAPTTCRRYEAGGLWARLIAGEAFGAQAEVTTHSPMFYVHWRPGSRRARAAAGEYPERAAYVAAGAVEVDGRTLHAGQMAGVRARRSRSRSRARPRDRHAAGRRAGRPALHRVELRLLVARSASSRPRPTGAPGA